MRCTIVALALVLSARATLAADPAPDNATFALIIGVNQSIDKELGRLHYADDDAARYFDLFRTLGARTYLLSRPDGNTRRLHTQASAEAYKPRSRELRRVVDLLAADIKKARERKLKTLLYFVYAGHGNVRNGQGYVTLEDARLGAEQLRGFFSRLGADQTHLIVDACHSYFLAHSRGPGGQRRQLQQGFSKIRKAFRDERLGLLLSTTAAKESHEWEAFQAGVFSHEVRSGLYGAADANRDGRVSYREIAAFVSRANAAIPNERFRPRIYARPPSSTPILLDLRRPNQKRLIVEGKRHARYLLEDTRGVRLADFHNNRLQEVMLLRPANGGLLYLRNLDEEKEYAIPEAPIEVRLAALTPALPRARVRGAAHHAFRLVFSLPFSKAVVGQYRMPKISVVGDHSVPSRWGWKRIVGWGSLALGTAALASGVVLTVTAKNLAAGSAEVSHEEAVSRNDRIDAYNTGAITLYSVAGAAVAAGIITLLWPEREPDRTITVAPAGTSVAITGTF